MVKCIEDKISKFIWDNNRPKITLEVLKREKQHGGYKLVDLAKKDKALKASWIRTIVSDCEMSNIMYHALNVQMKDKIWLCNLSSGDADKLFEGCDYLFWVHVLKAWCEVNYSESTYAWQPVWWNSNIVIGGKPIFYAASYERGLLEIGQLYVNGRYITQEAAMEQFCLSVMQFNATKSALQKLHIKQDENGLLAYQVMDSEKIVSKIYIQLNEKGQCARDRTAKKWEEELSCYMLEEDWQFVFKSCKSISNIPKLRSFQYRLLRRAIVTNTKLFYWGKRDNPECSFCELHPETMLHLFCLCPTICRKLWEPFVVFIKGKCNIDVIYNPRAIVFNQVSSVPVINFLCLVVKQYIYK